MTNFTLSYPFKNTYNEVSVHILRADEFSNTDARQTMHGRPLANLLMTDACRSCQSGMWLQRTCYNIFQLLQIKHAYGRRPSMRTYGRPC